jgi:hypothetical protein
MIGAPVIEHHQPAFPAPFIDLNRELASIADVETGNNDLAVGKKKERSRYQITKERWRAAAPSIPFERAWDHKISFPIAKSIVFEIISDLNSEGIPITPESVARGWNPKAPPDYAIRIGNLYRDAGTP